MRLIMQGEGGLQELAQLMQNQVEIEQGTLCFLLSVTRECYNKQKHDSTTARGYTLFTPAPGLEGLGSLLPH